MNSTTHLKDDIEESVWKSIAADPIRGEVLELLDGSPCPLSLADLAIELARETDTEIDDTEWGRAKQLRTRLHHCHVPKLQCLGLVEFDCDRMTVTLTQEANLAAGVPTDASDGTN